MSVGTLSPTAERLVDSLPNYYWQNPILIRILQAWANEIDRIDGLLDAMKNGFVPALADDTLGLLTIWERIMRLPVAPGATVVQRQQALCAAWRRRSAVSASQVAAVLGSGFVVLRDTPGVLEDTLRLLYGADTYQAGVIVANAQRMWPAHRVLHIEYAGGFLWDDSEWDRDNWGS